MVLAPGAARIRAVARSRACCGSRHAQQSSPPMLVSRVLRRPPNTLRVRSYASKVATAVPKAVPGRATTAAGSPATATGGEYDSPPRAPPPPKKKRHVL
jgi:hypothetical protein